MRRVLTPLVIAAAVAAFAPGAQASTKCSTGSPYETITVTGTGCAKAKKVLQAYFADHSAHPSGFSCHQKQYPGGVTTICRKGTKKIKHQSAD